MAQETTLVDRGQQRLLNSVKAPSNGFNHTISQAHSYRGPDELLLIVVQHGARGPNETRIIAQGTDIHLGCDFYITRQGVGQFPEKVFDPVRHFAPKHVRTNIQFSSIVNDAQVLLFTSTQPGEGKTETVSNVAVVSAQAGKRVLLVDADLRKPQLHHRFQISNLDGLSSILIREKSMEQAVVASTQPNLYLLPSGPIPPNPSEMLSSRYFFQLVQKWRQDYDLIFIDSPPVLSVTDALILSQVSDGVVFVVDATRTPRNHARKAVAALQQVNAKVLGVVLNRVQRRDSGYAYSYYYYSYSSASHHAPNVNP